MTRPDVGDVADLLARDDSARRALQKRVLTVVVVSQVLGGAGLAAGITVGALLAEEMLGTSSLAGLPVGLFTLGSALSAFLVGRLSQRAGRRVGLGAGFAAGGLGAAGVVLAAVTANVVLLFASLFVYGAGTATNLQARYAGTDLALPAERGKAISVALVSTTFGAVAGPNLVEPLGRFATTLGIPPLAGPFLLAGAAFLAAGAVLVALLRPDPFLVARHLAATTTAPESEPPRGTGAGVAVGATVMLLTQVAMVAIMTMTPVHMRAHGHALGAVGLVIGVHVGAMFLPSPLTGALVDKVGRVPMAVASGVILLLAGVTAAVAPGDSLGLLILALALLGLGWNVGVITGTALVVDATVPENRARTQGAVDVLIALGGAGGGAMSGVVVAGTSFAGLALAGGVLALLLVPAVVVHRRAAARPAPLQAGPS
ncbi:MFS transporter [Georgenia sp. H159]|uniref:MFS transporter n=1 Tax=Georgenia sp. H159 TaxID=3076115 RepID=UPI002D793000|nr:MFS transporter [Georgenia sp. H159]